MKFISAIANSSIGNSLIGNSSIVPDRSFKAISTLSCLGMALSFGLIAAGMDLNAVWF